jgi:hypothetical protein
MASLFLTVASTISCPHGGTVIASTSNTRVRAAGEVVLRSTDGFTVGGCTYTIGTVPHPCVRVQWDVHAERHASQGDPSLTEESIGLCLAADGGAQGTAVISSTQRRAAGT